MARRTYGEDQKRTVERSVEDREVIESFVEELGGESGPEAVLEGADSSDNLEATARYELVHPYEGENFRDALMRGEDVTARVELYVEPEGSETEVYTGHVTYDAHGIFDPAVVAGVGSESSVSEDEMDDGSDIEAGGNVDSDSAVALND